MTRECQSPVTHIDTKGFVYCAPHGLQRRSYGQPWIWDDRGSKGSVSVWEDGVGAKHFGKPQIFYP
jgi:hypothetical protein